MKFEKVEELTARGELFVDSDRPATENKGPHLIVVDNFYPDPARIRATALAQEFFQYSPPLDSQVGQAIASQFTDTDPHWFATCLHRYHGEPVNNPQSGLRYAGEEVREKLEKLLGEQIDHATWPSLGDGWNGAFHVQLKGRASANWSIHHHYKEGDVYPHGWSGLVYLSPGAPETAGTSIWLDKKSGRCIAQAGVIFTKEFSRFEKLLTITNKFNRLILFRENVLHRAEPGFGDCLENGRLTQTFFFLSNKFQEMQSPDEWKANRLTI